MTRFMREIADYIATRDRTLHGIWQPIFRRRVAEAHDDWISLKERDREGNERQPEAGCSEGGGG